MQARKHRKPVPKAQRRAATRAALMKAARVLFAAKGYEATGTEELVAAASVTRGALYFHFKDKVDLFTAVFDDVSAEIRGIVDSAADKATGARSALVAGGNAFLDAATEESRRRIYLVDALSVLGLGTWRAFDEKHGTSSLRAGVRAAMLEGGLGQRAAEPITRVLNGAFNDLAIWISEAPPEERATRRAAARRAVAATIAGLFPEP